MPTNKKYLANFESGKYYHVYNRTNNKEDLFKDDLDKMVFLNKIKSYSEGYFDVVAYCLLENHFHLLIKVHPIQSIISHLKRFFEFELSAAQNSFLSAPDESSLNQTVVSQLRSLFISYTIGINKKHNRKGNLFNRSCKRIYVDDISYLKKLVLYIHNNPIKHLLRKDINSYEWSSFFELTHDSKFLCNQESLIKIFGREENLIEIHSKNNNYKEIADILME